MKKMEKIGLLSGIFTILLVYLAFSGENRLSGSEQDQIITEAFNQTLAPVSYNNIRINKTSSFMKVELLLADIQSYSETMLLQVINVSGKTIIEMKPSEMKTNRVSFNISLIELSKEFKGMHFFRIKANGFSRTKSHTI